MSWRCRSNPSSTACKQQLGRPSDPHATNTDQLPADQVQQCQCFLILTLLQTFQVLLPQVVVSPKATLFDMIKVGYARCAALQSEARMYTPD